MISRLEQNLIAVKLAQRVYSDGIIVGHSKYLVDKSTDGLCFIIFAGTQNIKDFLVDISVIPSHGIHSGFLELWKFLRENGIEQEIEKAINEKRKIVFGGHSLGGALALLAHDDNPGLSRAVTWGCPRVWTRWSHPTNRTYFDHTRYFRSKDEVPELPHFLYTHFDTKSVQIGRCTAWLKNFDDHSIDLYASDMVTTPNLDQKS